MRRLLLVILIASSGCTRLALNTVADALAAPGKTYARDDDPELVRDAVPVIIKLMEQIHDGVPDHRGLCEALARSVTAYGVAFVEEEADRVAERDVAASKLLYTRARKLFLRARGYGLDGLELALPGARQALLAGTRDQMRNTLARASKDHVGLLYWTAAAWGSAISTGKDDMKLVGQLPAVETLMRRALELDESFDEGAIHEFFVVWDAARSEKEGGGVPSARNHLARARALSGNKKLGVLVSFAESVDVGAQNKAEFEKMLGEVVGYDVDGDLDHRLANLIAQRRARWLLSRTADLFAE